MDTLKAMMTIKSVFVFLVLPLKCATLKLSQERPTCDPLNNIYVINLKGPQGEERRELMAEELRLHNLNATFFPAFSKHDISEWYTPKEEIAAEDIRRRDGHHPISSFEIALSKSHKSIYQEIQKKGIQCALVFEDDVNLACNFKKRIQEFVDNEVPKMTNGFHLIKLDHCSRRIPDSSVEPFELQHGQGGACSSAYIVSEEGAVLLEAANTPLWMNADGNMDPNHIKHSNGAKYLPLKDYTVKPQAAYQANEHVAGGRLESFNKLQSEFEKCRSMMEH